MQVVIVENNNFSIGGHLQIQFDAVACLCSSFKSGKGVFTAGLIIK